VKIIVYDPARTTRPAIGLAAQYAEGIPPIYSRRFTLDDLGDAGWGVMLEAADGSVTYIPGPLTQEQHDAIGAT
jgi:hypothetical protein